MKKILEKVKNSALLNNLDCKNIEKVFDCLSARAACYKKGEIIMTAGDNVTFVGLIISGGIKIIKEDRRGNISMLTELSESEMFGEILVSAGIAQSPVTIQAACDTEILHISGEKIIAPCSAACPLHVKLIENMLRHIAKKNFMLNRKIEVLSKRTTREKLSCFFDLQRGSAREFTLALNREEMAQYLCVDRSAMSSELCRMRDEGLIRFNKNKFEIL